MALKYEETSPLTFKKKEIKLNLFGSDTTKAPIYCSSPWGAMRGYINGEIDKLKKASPKKARLQDSLYYVKQAEQFFIASNHVPLLTKTTLLYYSMMNLTKCYLALNNKPTGTHHGLTIDYKKTTPKIKILNSYQGTDMTFEHFSSLIGCNLKTTSEFTFSELTKNLLEVHNLNHSLNSSSLNYLPVELELREYTSSKQKKYALFLKISKEDERIYSSKWNRILSVPNKFTKVTTISDKFNIYKLRANNLEYSKLKGQIDSLGKKIRETRRFSSMMSAKSKSRFYFHLEDRDYSNITYSYMTMFLLGHIARYNPRKAEEYLQGKNYSIITEITNLCPTQFLYKMANFITGTIVLPDNFKIQI